MPLAYIVFIFAMLGLIVGSFLNVLVIRHGVRGLGGRSGCMSCRHTLAWYDLLPVFSWLALRGKCRYCKSKVSSQYILVEIATAIMFGGVGFLSSQLPIVSVGALLAVVASMVAIATYDIRHTIIPEVFFYYFATFTLLFALMTSEYSLMLLLLAGPIASLPLYLLWAVSHGRWMGFGDVKLALGIGWLVGPINAFPAIMSAFMIGAAILLPVMAIKKLFIIYSSRVSNGSILTMQSEVPFGPFLLISATTFLVLNIYGINIYDLL